MPVKKSSISRGSRRPPRVEEPVPKQITFVVNVKLLRLSRRHVESCIRGLSPEPIQRHAVEVGGTTYPIKQVFEAITLISPAQSCDATSVDLDLYS